MKKIVLVTVVVLSAVASGCATHASLTLRSDPEGAHITEVEADLPHGVAPVTVKYDPTRLEQSKDSADCYLVRGFKAQWVSGATTTINPIKLCGSKAASYNLTFNRNPSAPGMDKDLQFAMQVKTLRAQEAQAKAARDAADYAWSRNYRENYRDNSPGMNLLKPDLDCTPNSRGGLSCR